MDVRYDEDEASVHHAHFKFKLYTYKEED